MGRGGTLGRDQQEQNRDGSVGVFRLLHVTRLCWTTGTGRQAASTEAGKAQRSPSMERSKEPLRV